MESKPEQQKYRASVMAIIVNRQKNFFLVQQQKFRADEWDFVKGGMHVGESEIDTLKREIGEELGDSFEYKILRRGVWNIIHEWPVEMQLERGFRGQARTTYWVKHTSGEINPKADELLATKWVKETDLAKILITSGASKQECKILLDDWRLLKQEFPTEFV